MATTHPRANPARAWLAAVLRGEAPPLPAEFAADTGGLLAAAQEEGVAALCHQGMQGTETWEHLPPHFRDGLTLAAHGAMAAALLWEIELKAVLSRLAGEGLPVLVLKGAALAYTLYDAPHLRPRSDADLLLPSRDAAERAWRLVQPLGYQRRHAVAGELVQYELGCHKPSRGNLMYALDIHWRLSAITLFAERFAFAELAAAAVPIAALGPPARGLSSLHALLHACMHRVGHRLHGHADSLIGLYDIHLLAQRLTAEQWPQVTALATERGLCATCLDGLSGAQSRFATHLPENLLSRLRAGAARETFDVQEIGRPLTLEWATFRALPCTAMRLRWLGQYFFPRPEFIRKKYDVRNPLWLPWYYGVRIARAITKRFHPRP